MTTWPCTHIVAFATLLACAAGCRTRLSASAAPVTSDEPMGCPDPAPTCVARGAACTRPSTVKALCDERARAWSCPAGSREYARAPASPPCRPFRHAAGLASIGPWGLGSMSGVPIDDERCLWIADSVTLADGTEARNVALEPDPDAPFGTCPETSRIPPTPIVTIEGGDDPSLLVQINGGFRLGGVTRVMYRLFRIDPLAGFGVTLLGGGAAPYDPVSRKVVIPAPSLPWRWGLDLDLGDAVFPAGDGAHALVWGCALPGGLLLEQCRLARLDAAGAVELFAGQGRWIASVRATDGAPTFESGPWTSSVTAAPSGLRHIYVIGFGSELQSHVAESALGPWSEGPGLGRCDLPANDPKAMCAGPIVHEELMDPTRPGQYPITYGVGTTGAGTGNREDYWTRLAWVE